MAKRRSARWAALLILALFLVACTPGPGAEEPPGTPGTEIRETKGELIYAISREPVYLNPLLATDPGSELVNSRIFQGLVRLNERLEPVPALATSWSFSKDGLEWTFNLRDDVYWHDGVLFTANDVKFTYDLVKHPDYNGVKRSDLRVVDRVEIISDHEIKLVLNQPSAPLLGKLVLGIIPEHIFGGSEVARLKEHPANDRPIGTGPYTLGEWKKGESIVLKASSHYWGEGPWIREVRFRLYPDDGAALAALEARAVDLVGNSGIPLDEFARIRQQHGDWLNFWEMPSNGYYYIGLKQTHPILQDRRVRQALAFALDRPAIVEAVYGGHATVVNANLPPVSWAYCVEGLNPYDYSPETAISLLEQAGWATTGSDGVRQNDQGERLSFQLLTAAGNYRIEQVLKAVEESWRRVGVEVKVRFLPWAELLANYLDTAKFEAYMLGWNLDPDPDCFPFFHSRAGLDAAGNLVGFNDVEYANPRLDQLLEQGRVTLDPGERRRIYHEIQLMLNEELPYIFMFSPHFVIGINSKLGGVTVSTLGPIFPEQWYVTERE